MFSTPVPQIHPVCTQIADGLRAFSAQQALFSVWYEREDPIFFFPLQSWLAAFDPATSRLRLYDFHPSPCVRGRTLIYEQLPEAESAVSESLRIAFPGVSVAGALASVSRMFRYPSKKAKIDNLVQNLSRITTDTLHALDVAIDAKQVEELIEPIRTAIARPVEPSALELELVDRFFRELQLHCEASMHVTSTPRQPDLLDCR